MDCDSSFQKSVKTFFIAREQRSSLEILLIFSKIWFYIFTQESYWYINICISCLVGFQYDIYTGQYFSGELDNSGGRTW